MGDPVCLVRWLSGTLCEVMVVRSGQDHRAAGAKDRALRVPVHAVGRCVLATLDPFSGVRADAMPNLASEFITIPS